MEKTKRTIFKPGARIGPCEIIELIGSGGMGDVYRAKHTALGKEVALKLLASHYALKKDYVDGFLREAKLAAKLEDAHIVQIYDVGSDGATHYIVMQLAKGISLRERLKQGRLSVAESLRVIEQIARGLAVAHEAGIVHRDIKPHNVILSEDDLGLKILDFGLARLEQSLHEPEQMAELVGSVAYMSPEQCDYGPVDARADIYALGVTAFQCLTGGLPFGIDSSGGNFETVARHQFESPVAPSLLNRAVPLTVSRVVLRMMAKLPGDRYANVQDVLEELRLLRRHSLPVTAWPWVSRPLNPRALKPGHANAERLRKALVNQRDVMLGGRPLTPLCLLADESRIEWEEAQVPVEPADMIELEVNGPSEPRTYHLSAASGAVQEAIYRDRFRVVFSKTGILTEVILEGPDPLDAMGAQWLFDLLEALREVNGWGANLRLSLGADYAVQAQDVRWVIEVFNIAAANNCRLTLTVGSTSNHDTFMRLGLDQHIELTLELEQTDATADAAAVPASEINAKASWLAEAGTLPGMESLQPAARALAATLGRHLRTGDIASAYQSWKQLAQESRADRSSVLRGLRRELFDVLWQHGLRAYNRGEFAGAGEMFNRLVDLDPGRSEGHFGKGLVFKKQGKLDYASAFLTQAILAEPDNAELFYHRAIVRSRLADERGAMRDLNMAIEHNPRHANAYYNRSVLHKKMGRADLATRDMKIAQRLNPALRQAIKERAGA